MRGLRAESQFSIFRTLEPSCDERVARPQLASGASCQSCVQVHKCSSVMHSTCNVARSWTSCSKAQQSCTNSAGVSKHAPARAEAPLAVSNALFPALLAASTQVPTPIDSSRLCTLSRVGNFLTPSQMVASNEPVAHSFTQRRVCDETCIAHPVKQLGAGHSFVVPETRVAFRLGAGLARLALKPRCRPHLAHHMRSSEDPAAAPRAVIPWQLCEGPTVRQREHSGSYNF